MEHWSWYIESIYGTLVLIENTYEPWSWYRESIYTYGTVVMIQGINIYLWNSGHDTENQHIPMEHWSWYRESIYGTLAMIENTYEHWSWYIESTYTYGTLVMIHRINIWNIGPDREYLWTLVMIQRINIYLWNSGHDTGNQYIPMEQWSWYWESIYTYGTVVMILRINTYLWNIGHDT